MLFVLTLHGAALYELWSYRVIPTPDEAHVLIIKLIDSSVPQPLFQSQTVLPKPSKPQSPTKPLTDEPVSPQQLSAKTPLVIPDDPVSYAVPPPHPPEIDTLPSAQPLELSDELSIACSERSPPAYPGLSMRMNEQGKVVLRVELGEDGHVANAEVKQSSGYRRLDEAALSVVKTWRCRPSVRNGVVVRAVALQPFNFILEGS